MEEKHNLGIVAEAQQRAEQIVRHLKVTGILDTIAVLEAPRRALAQLGRNQFIPLAQIASNIGTLRIQSQMVAAAEAMARANKQNYPLLAALAPIVSVTPPCPTNAIEHLSRRLDQVEADNAALRKETHQLRQITRHNETHNPSDLPEHDVDGLFGSPN